jgi:hypothetical protein
MTTGRFFHIADMGPQSTTGRGAQWVRLKKNAAIGKIHSLLQNRTREASWRTY